MHATPAPTSPAVETIEAEARGADPRSLALTTWTVLAAGPQQVRLAAEDFPRSPTVVVTVGQTLTYADVQAVVNSARAWQTAAEMADAVFSRRAPVDAQRVLGRLADPDAARAAVCSTTLAGHVATTVHGHGRDTSPLRLAHVRVNVAGNVVRCLDARAVADYHAAWLRALAIARGLADGDLPAATGEIAARERGLVPTPVELRRP